MKKAALHNLGCKVNAYETEAMQQLLEEAGYKIVDFKELADVYIVNTCSVTNMADKKSRQMLHRAKKRNPNAIVVAAGCYVQAAAEELKKDLSIDLIIGNNKKIELIELLEGYDSSREMKHDHVISIGDTKEYEMLSVKKIAEHTRAFIKIQDGCNQFCSYCIIPYTRGRVRSRRPADVYSEIQELVKNGYKEIVLTGIHLSSYGIDFEDRKENLLSLIEKIHSIKGLIRIRLGSLEPRIVTEEFVEVLKTYEKVCPHFHLSLQSGCDEVLKRMNRKYNTIEYATCCEILRTHYDNPAITTDVIVGFPGETDAEFEQTRNYLEGIEFYEMHVFKYSKREKTKAAQMKEQVLESTKNVRSENLLNLDQKLSDRYRNSFLGKQTEVLLETSVEIDGQMHMIGYNNEYVKVVVAVEESKKNTVIKGQVIAIKDGALVVIPE